MVGNKFKNSTSPLLALIYPCLVAFGPKIHPGLLIISLSVPVVAFILAYRHIDPAHYPISRRVAFLVIGAPALFSMVGGWLDGQQFLPFQGLGFWVIVWGSLSLYCFTEKESDQQLSANIPASQTLIKLRTAHGMSAVIIILFALFHLANHLSGLWGGALHWEIMQMLRLVYRNPVVEIILISAIAFQLVSGVILAWCATKTKKELIPTLQAASGIYLLCFFSSHLSAVFRTRYLRGGETDWDWLTGSSLLLDDWNARLVGYYWFGVIAIGIHVAAGLRYILLAQGVGEKKAHIAFIGINLCMIIISSLIMTGLFMSSDPWMFGT